MQTYEVSTGAFRFTIWMNW